MHALALECFEKYKINVLPTYKDYLEPIQAHLT
jgi:hypothetical protein